MTSTYWVETLGCPKNSVDSDKLAGTLGGSGLAAADDVANADVVVVNTCAFIESARAESVEAILEADDRRAPGARLVITGCMAERHGDELRSALAEAGVDADVAGFGVPVRVGGGAVPVTLGRVADARSDSEAQGPVSVELTAGAGSPDQGRDLAGFDLLELPRPPALAPWAYVKIAEGCDRACGFCAIPSFRGPQRSRSIEAIEAEVEALGAAEVVLVAQDLASFGRDQGQGTKQLVELVGRLSNRVPWLRLLYLYPSELDDRLVEAILSTGVPYFDLSLQHVSRPLVRRMRRWGDGERFMERIRHIRALEPQAAFRSNFIVGYPGETEEDHDQLLAFVEEAELDWCGFFPWSAEDGTYAVDLDGRVADGLVAERLAELGELQDRITAEARDALIGSEVEVLVDAPGAGRTFREAPEIDGIVTVPNSLDVGEFHRVRVSSALGPDLDAS